MSIFYMDIKTARKKCFPIQIDNQIDSCQEKKKLTF